MYQKFSHDGKIDPSKDPTKRKYVDSDLESIINMAFKTCDKDRNGYI